MFLQIVRHVVTTIGGAVSCTLGGASDKTVLYKGDGAKAVVAPLKGRPRIEEKAKDDYSGRGDSPPLCWVNDVLRGSVLCEAAGDLLKCVKRLLLHPRVAR